MGLLDDYSGKEGALRPSWEHQGVLAAVHIQTMGELAAQGLRMFMETTVTDDCDDLAPDLVVFDKRYTPLAMIDVCIHAEIGAVMDKFKSLVARFPESEFFVYDYEENVLFKYEIREKCWVSSQNGKVYSKYLKNELMAYFKE